MGGTKQETKKENGEEENKQQFYEKAGQRYPTPSPGAGERVFYETLLKEKPESDIALVWAIEHGTLSKDEAAKRYQEYEKAKQRLRLQTFSSNSQPQKSSTKTAASASSATSSPATKKQKKSSNKDAGKVVDTTAVSAGDVGMNVGGDEGVGTVNLG